MVENEILDLLYDIKLIVIAILVIVSLLLFNNFMRLFSNLVARWTVNREKVFIHFSSQLYDQERYDELEESCLSKMKNWPNNPYPLYWLARSKYKKGEQKESEELFRKVLLMEPSWENAVTPYLDSNEKH